MFESVHVHCYTDPVLHHVSSQKRRQAAGSEKGHISIAASPKKAGWGTVPELRAYDEARRL